ncbi:serine protease inhibitor 77Ba-like [Anticarsia gemmatalis]|uniref:serine protease inhibitor 77Ba-like n=1 Tax=Anticarsia gemmatalis TaxID=129554 RepID=UPI003F7638A1
MKIISVIGLCALIVAQVSSQLLPYSAKVQWCNIHQDVTQDFRNALYDFSAKSFTSIGPEALHHFVFSPLSTWTILAAIAEGADPFTKQTMFQFLKLPNDLCLRLRYYELAATRFVPSDDVYLLNTRAIVIDEGVTINPIYNNFIFQNSLLDVMRAPIRLNPIRALEKMREIALSDLPKIDITGNSVFLDAMDYNGLWSTAFEDAVTEKAPFYDQAGNQIGAVDLMRVRRRVKMAYVPSINAKAIEIPIGYNGRYRMVFFLFLDNEDIDRAVSRVRNTLINEFLGAVRETYIPIEIAIPRVTITSEYDIRKILEDFRIKTLFTDPTVTKYISEPAAFPSSFVQRTTISIDKAGLVPAPYTYKPSVNASTGFDPKLGRDFIADRPFLFGLFDAETYTCLLSAVFSQPTYAY